jgi:hypothetical protein
VIAAMSLWEITHAVVHMDKKNLTLSDASFDRVFGSLAWEDDFLVCSLTTITRIGSDRSPLIHEPKTAQFSWWIQVAGFGEVVTRKLHSFLTKFGPQRGRNKLWQCVVGHTLLKGWEPT